MNDLNFSYSDFLALFTLVLTIGNMWRLAKEIRKPKQDLTEMVEDHHRLLEYRKEELEKIEKKADLSLRSVFHLMNYAADLESKDELKAALKDLQQEIINREMNV